MPCWRKNGGKYRCQQKGPAAECRGLKEQVIVAQTFVATVATGAGRAGAHGAAEIPGLVIPSQIHYGSSVVRCKHWAFRVFWRSWLPSGDRGVRRCLSSVRSLPAAAAETVLARVTLAVDWPPDLRRTASQRQGQGHGFAVSWPLPTRCRGDRCPSAEEAPLAFKDTVQVVRDRDRGGQPSLWSHRPAWPRCS